MAGNLEPTGGIILPYELSSKRFEGYQEQIYEHMHFIIW